MSPADYSVRPTDHVHGLPAITRQQRDPGKRKPSAGRKASRKKQSQGDKPADPPGESGKTDEEGNFVDVLA